MKGKLRSLKREISLLLAEVEAVKFGSFKLTSGRESFYYIDLRIVPSHPQAFRKIARLYGEEAKKIGLKNFNSVAGIPTAGMTFASVLAFNLRKPLIYVRKEAKAWGRGKRVEGSVKPGDSVLLVDDLITTGKSVLEAAEAVWEVGGKTPYALVLIDREEGGARNLASKGIKLHSFLKVSELFNHLYKAGYLEAEYRRKLFQQLKADSSPAVGRSIDL
ncbi:orotate phosphoribosyltransferase [Candidatus Hecatella orcuttiae]|uniref:orotate phosphoribosyltransferase n=1 Tax=Candidatus Hecatella orcuttiae TaxID=1935119 RepID=UPI002867F21B|nr:orotate phosphoribosyltransferase [Candidatus Hecatella orcuttiae]